MSNVFRGSIRVVVAVLLIGALTTGSLIGCGGIGAADAVAQEKVARRNAKQAEEGGPQERAKPTKGKAKGKAGGDAANPFPRRLDVPEFPRGLDWLNSGALHKKDLKGKFVLLDFWTYCCINCMHILPELKKLEEKYPNELVVIGVHSAKFEGEKETENIRDAILRHNIVHPVVNDADHKIWDMFGVNSWPTILMIDPEGKAVWGRAGEFKAEEVDTVLQTAIPYYRSQGLLSDEPVKFELESEKVAATPLRFPGKLLADEKSNRLFIADSNHNRIVIASLDGQLIETIGSGKQGHDDGDFATATFNQPQGMALLGETLYVADTENHMLRKVDLSERTVSTISGDGQQAASAFPGADRFAPLDDTKRRWVGKPKATQLNSPWDLWIHDEALYIAMAGPHQIWKMPLDESEIGPYAGNGREDIVDGGLLPRTPYQLGFSSFAQPSGLTSDGTWLYVADSEGSSIRAVPFNPAADVKTVVGTNELANGRLFHFGDVDGPRNRVKLQHCLAVVYDAGKLYVADTYNNKIKVVDAKTGATKTLVGTGTAGRDDAAATFDEPAGLSLAGRKLYVADTNNHAIRVVDLETQQVATLAIAGLAAPQQSKDAKPDFSDAAQIKLKPVTVQPRDGKIMIEVSLAYPAGWKANPLGKPSYWVDSPASEGVIERGAFGRKRLDEPAASWTIELPVRGAGEDTLQVSTNYYYCQAADEGVCKVGAVVFTVPLTIADDAPGATVPLHYAVPE
jgi:DNA-binding beta-propeller fold protein YncE